MSSVDFLRSHFIGTLLEFTCDTLPVDMRTHQSRSVYWMCFCVVCLLCVLCVFVMCVFIVCVFVVCVCCVFVVCVFFVWVFVHFPSSCIVTQNDTTL